MNKVRWGVIGAGDIVRKRIATALRESPNSEFVSVSRSKAELAEASARELGARKWFADWREQIADSDIDAVYIATPVYLHAEQAIAAAEAGKHVLCEKPMALTVAECDQMIAAAHANNVKLGIAYYRRFYPAVVRVKEIIESGEIGKVSIAQINCFEAFDPSPEHPRRWFVEKEKSGGGPMMDFGCHRIEIFNNIFGKASRIESIVANDALGREVEDTATAIIQYETGVSATVTVTHAAVESQDTLHIFGSKGSIHIAHLNSGEMTIRTAGGERHESHPPSTNFHEPLIADLTDAILNDRTPAVTGEDGREVSSMIAAIYERGQQKTL